MSRLSIFVSEVVPPKLYTWGFRASKPQIFSLQFIHWYGVTTLQAWPVLCSRTCIIYCWLVEWIATQKSKSQVLTKFSLGEGGILGNLKLKVTSPDQIVNSGDGGWNSWPTSDPNLSPPWKFQSQDWGRGRGGGLYLWFLAQNFLTQTWSCIADSLSHTMCGD